MTDGFKPADTDAVDLHDPAHVLAILRNASHQLKLADARVVAAEERARAAQAQLASLVESQEALEERQPSAAADQPTITAEELVEARAQAAAANDRAHVAERALAASRRRLVVGTIGIGAIALVGGLALGSGPLRPTEQPPRSRQVVAGPVPTPAAVPAPAPSPSTPTPARPTPSAAPGGSVIAQSLGPPKGVKVVRVVAVSPPSDAPGRLDQAGSGDPAASRLPAFTRLQAASELRSDRAE